MVDKVVDFKPSFTPQMEDLLRYARKKKPTVLLIALVEESDGDRKLFVDWSLASTGNLMELRALIDNQIEQTLFRQDTRYTFVTPEYYTKWPDDQDDPDELA